MAVAVVSDVAEVTAQRALIAPTVACAAWPCPALKISTGSEAVSREVVVEVTIASV
jgi:hypothetical protein